MKISSHWFSLWPEIFKISFAVYKEPHILEIEVGFSFFEWSLLLTWEPRAI